MKKSDRILLGLVALVFVFLCVIGWMQNRPPIQGVQPAPSPDPDSFRIVAESEVQSLADAGILADFTTETGIDIALNYAGPVDIQMALANLEDSNPHTVDAYWAGSSLWLRGSSSIEPESVMKTYVVLAVDSQTAEALGWNSAEGITARDLVEAIRAGQINLAMTSASQSTPGAAFYLAMYTALTGERVLTSDDLGSETTVDALTTMLAGVDRSAGSLGHLKRVFVEDRVSGANQYNAIVIYESLAIQMNRELVAQSKPPLTIFYVEDATAIADVPIRYVDNGSDEKLAQYEKLVEYLRRPEIQARIQALGWRTNPIGMAQPEADPAVFNPAWGIDTRTEFREMTFPKPPVTTAALNQYQGLFRKPSFTVYCLDYSGSMVGVGRPQMENAMDLLLDQERAGEVMLQATTEDITTVFGFGDTTFQIGQTTNGSDPAALKELSNLIAASTVVGGTALYDCVRDALDFVGRHYEPERYAFSVIALTDGVNSVGSSAQDFSTYYANKGLDVPVYGIAFGNADFSEMSVFNQTGGAVYDGRQDVGAAFRAARSNN